MKTTCPTCGIPLQIGDADSSWVVCPACRGMVRASSASSDAKQWGTTSRMLKGQFGILIVILLAFAAVIVLEPRGQDAYSVFACLTPMLALAYFLCLCLCGTAPDPTARHSVLACVLTLVFGSIGLFFAALMSAGPPPRGMPREYVQIALLAGGFTVYFAAFVFLMRFHASVGRALGNRALQRHSYLFLPTPFLVLAANWFLSTVSARPFFMRRQVPPWDDLVPWVYALVNFGVFVWYAILLVQSFRTIDRGPKPGDADESGPSP
jgi:hypothetical protein